MVRIHLKLSNAFSSQLSREKRRGTSFIFILFLKLYPRIFFTDDKKGAMLTAEQLQSVSNSFNESLNSRLWGLSPASVSLRWFSCAVDAITFAHSAARSLIYELSLDDGDSLSSWYSDDSLKVLDICNCISSDIERLCLRHQKLRTAVKLLRSDGNPSEEEIHQARDWLEGWVGEGEGADGYVNSMGDIEGLTRDLAASMAMSAPRGKDSPVERVVCHAIRAVSFVTAFLTGVISSGLTSSSRAVVCVHVPGEFPWGDSVRAIQSAVVVDSGYSEETDERARILRELDDMEARVKELDEVEASVWDVLEAIDDVAGTGGGGEIVGRLRKAAAGLEKANEATLDVFCRLREGVTELFLTVTRMRKELVEGFTARERKGPSAPGH